MAIFPIAAFAEFLQNGRLSLGGKNLPPDAETDDTITALQAGLSAKHFTATAGIRLLSFSGVDGTGEAPDLGCSLPGAKVGDVVSGLLDNGATFTDSRALFESVITVDDKIQQTSLTDLSTDGYIVLLSAA